MDIQIRMNESLIIRKEALISAVVITASFFIPLPMTAYAQNTIEQVDNGDFPAAIIIDDRSASNERTRALLIDIVQPQDGKIKWSSTNKVTPLEQKLDTDGIGFSTDGLKAHHQPLAAIVRSLEVHANGTETPNVVSLAKNGAGFEVVTGTEEGLEKGVYILDLAVRSEMTSNIGIYETLLYVDEPERDDLYRDQLVNSFTDAMKQEFAMEAAKL